MNLIVNVDQNWGIGKNNQLLERIPEDMKMFRQMTTGRVIVMGRKTLESFPGGRPLSDRTNLVLTKNSQYDAKGAQVVTGKDQLLEIIKQYAPEDVFVVGGESVYRMLLPDCQKAYITKVDAVHEADTFFPDLDRDENWKLIKKGEVQTYSHITYRFLEYQRVST